MRKTAAAVLLLLGSMTVAGCGGSLDELNRLAATGSIHEAAPVKAHVQIEIAAPPAGVWALLVDASSWPTWQKNINRSQRRVHWRGVRVSPGRRAERRFIRKYSCLNRDSASPGRERR